MSSLGSANPTLGNKAKSLFLGDPRETPAKVDRIAALGVITIADGPAPAENKDNPRAAPYRKKSAR